MRLKPPHLALALAVLVALPLAAAEPTEKAPAKPSSPAADAAMKIHVDPATGQVVAPKSDPAAAKAAMSAAPVAELPPLPVENVTAKAGGKKVNLQGRFMMEMTATVRPDGTIAGTCTSNETGAKPEAAKETRHER